MASVLSEYFKSPERTIFWNEELKANVDPFEGLEGGFFTTNWEFKVCVYFLEIQKWLIQGSLSAFVAQNSATTRGIATMSFS